MSTRYIGTLIREVPTRWRSWQYVSWILDLYHTSRRGFFTFFDQLCLTLSLSLSLLLQQLQNCLPQVHTELRRTFSYPLLAKNVTIARLLSFLKVVWAQEQQPCEHDVPRGGGGRRKTGGEFLYYDSWAFNHNAVRAWPRLHRVNTDFDYTCTTVIIIIIAVFGGTLPE